MKLDLTILEKVMFTKNILLVSFRGTSVVGLIGSSCEQGAFSGCPATKRVSYHRFSPAILGIKDFQLGIAIFEI